MDFLVGTSIIGCIIGGLFSFVAACSSFYESGKKGERVDDAILWLVQSGLSFCCLIVIIHLLHK